MTYLVGRDGLTAFFYVPMFITATIMGGSVAYVFLIALRKNGMLAKIQDRLGGKTYEGSRTFNKEATGYQE